MDWRKELYELDMEPLRNIDDLANEQTLVKENEIGFVHPTTGVGVVTRNDGNLEGFADHSLGFQFDRETQSLSVFASQINLFTHQIYKHDGKEIKEFYQDEWKDVQELLKDLTSNEK